METTPKNAVPDANSVTAFRPGPCFDFTINDAGVFTLHQITYPDGTVAGKIPPKDPNTPKCTVVDTHTPGCGPGIVVERTPE